MSLRDELLVHAKAVGLEDDPSLSDEQFQSSILAVINDLPDGTQKGKEPGTWHGMPVATQDWSNALFEGETGASPDHAKADATKAAKEKAKVAAAKAAAKKKSADVTHSKGGKLFQKGSSSEAIYNIVKEAMPAGISKDDVVTEAVKRKIKSTNIKARTVDVLKMCTVVKGQSYSGIMKLVDGLYFTTPEDELKALSGGSGEKTKADVKVKEEPKAEAKPDEPSTAEATDGDDKKSAAKTTKGKAKGKGKKKK